MRGIKLFFALVAVTFLLITACNTSRQGAPQASLSGNYWAKDNLDLQRVSYLLEESDTPQEFEAYLNRRDGIDNLDLNGDGYVDYISVEEFGDRGPYERGLSLYTRYGPDDVQDVATIYFYRDEPDWTGARVLVVGDDNIYGDNVYYETNWAERALALVGFLFTPRDEYYRSPYYYNYYPPDYVAYEVVETPLYVARVERLVPEPVLVFTTAPTFISKIKIKSPNDNKRFDRIYARLAKPTRQQIEWVERNPAPPERVKLDQQHKREAAPGQQVPPGQDKMRIEPPGQPGPPAKMDEKPGRQGNPGKEPGGDKQKPQRPASPGKKESKPPQKPGGEKKKG
jgi:hypothetical protein